MMMVMTMMTRRMMMRILMTIIIMMTMVIRMLMDKEYEVIMKENGLMLMVMNRKRKMK